VNTEKKPLEGVRVLDLTRIISGPYCTRMLADCGAEVIKVEPLGGEHMRRKQPMREGASTYFGHLNVGKKCIELDFGSEAGLATIRRLATHCDVVVENFRPGVVRELGLDYPTLAQGRTDLVYCSISGFGKDGPRAGHPAYAPILHALSGHDLAAMDYHYQHDVDKPPRSGIWYADLVGGVFAFGAIQTALVGKLLHGFGQFIDVSLMDTMINLLVLEVQETQTPSAFERWLATPISAADGFVMIVPITKRNFQRLTEVVGHPEWLDDARFNTQAAREKHWAVLMNLIEAWTRVRPAKECEAVFMAAGVPCSRYLTVAQALEDEQVSARGLLREVGSGAGAFKVPNLPFIFSNSSLGANDSAPSVGAHTDEILGLLKGFSPTGRATG